MALNDAIVVQDLDIFKEVGRGIAHDEGNLKINNILKISQIHSIDSKWCIRGINLVRIFSLSCGISSTPQQDHYQWEIYKFQ